MSGLRSALNAAGRSEAALERAPSAAIAKRMLAAADKRIDAIVVDLSAEREALPLLSELQSKDSPIPAYASALGFPGSEIEAAATKYGGRVFRTLDELMTVLPAASPTIHQAAARLVLFAPAQEGAGASTIALHVAALLAQEHGQRTLFAELDYHSDSVACRLRLNNSRSLVDLAPGEDWRAVLTDWHGLHVLAAPSSTRSLRRRGLPDLPGVLEDTATDFDVVVGDLPCNTAVAPARVLSSAERIYVVATAEVTSLHLARRRILELVAVGARPDAIRLIINRNRPGAVDAEVARQVTGLDPACRLPNDYAAASAAETEARTVEGGSPLGLALASLAADLMGKPATAQPVRKKRWGRLLVWR